MAPTRDGIFLPDPVVRQPGVYFVELGLTSPQVNSQQILLRTGGIRVPTSRTEKRYAL